MEVSTYTESKRAQYMRGDLTFTEYYGLLVEHLGEESLRKALPRTRSNKIRTPAQWRALLAKDEHLNNVPLGQWDEADTFVRRRVSYAGGTVKLEPITGSGGWSLSDSVCVLKTTARRYAESESN